MQPRTYADSFLMPKATESTPELDTGEERRKAELLRTPLQFPYFPRSRSVRNPGSLGGALSALME